jgi:hypothetical protein
MPMFGTFATTFLSPLEFPPANKTNHEPSTEIIELSGKLGKTLNQSRHFLHPIAFSRCACVFAARLTALPYWESIR